jgi:hypothetical protein
LIDYLGNVIIFYFDRDDELGQDGLKKIREWYRREKETRRIKREFYGFWTESRAGDAH